MYLCKKCGQYKNKEDFYISDVYSRGFSYYCAECERKRKRVIKKSKVNITKQEQLDHKR